MNNSTYKDRNDFSEQGLNSVAPFDSSINLLNGNKNKTRNTNEFDKNISE